MNDTINFIYYIILLSFTPNSDFIPYVCTQRTHISLKRFICILVLILTTVSSSTVVGRTCSDETLPANKRDSSVFLGNYIMQQVIDNAAGYESSISKYEAEIYTKGRTEVLKHNYLIRFAHTMFPVDRRNRDMIFEMVTHSTFNTPNNFLHQFEAVNGNSIPNNKKQQEVLLFLNLNVYSPTAYNEAILMPVAKNAFNLYRFKLEGVEDTAGMKVYKIRFTPKLMSQQLVFGYLYVVDKAWTIDKIDLSGSFSFANFSMVMTFGRNFRRFLLPEKADLSLSYRLFGNMIVSTYHSVFKYKSVGWVEEDSKERKWKPLDLTSYYRLSSDTIPIVVDTAYWNTKRDIPLTPDELKAYQTTSLRDTTARDTASLDKYVKLTQRLTNTLNLDFKSTRVRYSGFLNPFQLGFSPRNGFTYKQQIRISKTFSRDRQLRFRPEIGFVFKRKEIFFKVGGDWEYKPEKRGTLSLMVANSNQGYSSEMMKEINEQLKDSAFNFDDLNLKYFKHYYVDLRNNIELFNGFQFSAGLSYHRRMPAKKTGDKETGEGVDDMISDNYDDFIPMIGFSYTPRQFYRMDGYRKEYIRSYYPTFAIEITRAIPGVLGSTGNYGRVEADVHQSLPLGLLRRVNYHVSGGFYTQQKSTYFADFSFFARRNFPDSWGDRIGGVFNLLDREWFNASDKYLQVHLMYESPFILSRFLETKRASRYILSERFYLSQLWTPALPSYTEIGYGFGNYIFNIAAFVGFDRWNYDGIGVKFTFELFQ